MPPAHFLLLLQPTRVAQDPCPCLSPDVHLCQRTIKSLCFGKALPTFLQSPSNKGEAEFSSRTTRRSGSGYHIPLLSCPQGSPACLLLSGLQYKESLLCCISMHMLFAPNLCFSRRGTALGTHTCSLPCFPQQDLAAGCRVKPCQPVLSPVLQALSNTANTKAGGSSPAPVHVS